MAIASRAPDGVAQPQMEHRRDRQAGERIAAVQRAQAGTVFAEVARAVVQDVEQQRDFDGRTDQHRVLRRPAVWQHAGRAQGWEGVAQVHRQEAQRHPARVALALAPSPHAQAEAQQHRQQAVQVQEGEAGRVLQRQVGGRVEQPENRPGEHEAVQPPAVAGQHADFAHKPDACTSQPEHENRGRGAVPGGPLRPEEQPTQTGEGRLEAQHARHIGHVGGESTVPVQPRVYPAQEHDQQAEAQVAADQQEGPGAALLQFVGGQQLDVHAQWRRVVLQAQPHRAR